MMTMKMMTKVMTTECYFDLKKKILIPIIYINFDPLTISLPNGKQQPETRTKNLTIQIQTKRNRRAVVGTMILLHPNHLNQKILFMEMFVQFVLLMYTYPSWIKKYVL